MHLALAILLDVLTAKNVAILPPQIPWDGASRSLVVSRPDPWVTPSEATDFAATPRYDETIAYLRRLVAASPQLKLVSLGRSDEGRELWMVVASKERAFTPEALRRTQKPVVFAQAAIHAGEMDGKDAGLMLLRDMTVRGTKRELLDGANFLFVPIFNVDGHERVSRYSRINQRGPQIVGWRTTSRNLNLNRDYVKADTAEMRAMIHALRTWQPDLYIDLHVTDGSDYQYDITYGWNGEAGHSPAIARWLDNTFRTPVDRAMREAGHIPGPLIFTDDPLRGIGAGQSDPRLSNGYGDARHLPTILVENHSLKPYDQRVLGTYVFLEHTLRTIAREAASLRAAVASDKARRPERVPLSWKAPENAVKPTIELLGVENRRTLSAVSGTTRIEWLGKPVTARVPVDVESEVETSAPRAKAYWIPAQWREVIALLDLHGIPYERIDAPREMDIEMLRLSDPKYDARQFEGHVRVTASEKPEQRRERFAAGSVRVPTDNPLGTLAVILLEPSSPDSLFQWGFFHSILSPTEYVEGYIMEPMAERMLAEDPQLAEEFQKKLESDAAFRGDSRARLQWFYQRTPWYDERALLYPVGRER
jgi:Zinc carboxypeptidase